MGQLQNIIQSFNDCILTNATVSSQMPGGLHHAFLLDEEATRPYGVIEVNELSREYNSGWGSLAMYEVELTVYGKQRVKPVGDTQENLGFLFNTNLDLGSVTGAVMSVVPITGSLEEDEVSIQGKDVLLSKNKWKIQINEV